MKVVINRCHGGFGLSKEACQRYWDIKGTQVWIEDDIKFKSLGLFTVWLLPPEERIPGDPWNWHEMTIAERQAHNKTYSEQTWDYRDVERNDPLLIQVVEELGDKANGGHAELAVVEIPDEVQWTVEEYDGWEHIAEVHRVWY